MPENQVIGQIEKSTSGIFPDSAIKPGEISKKTFSTKDWLSYLDRKILPPNPPARPRSPFIPGNFRDVFNLVKIGAGLGFSMLTKKPFVWGKPVIAHIEPTSLCNLKCPLCPSGNGSLTRIRERMDYENFKTIIDKLPRTVKMLLLWNQGEPFIVKDLVKMISFAKRRKIYIVTSTNGHYFRKEKVVQAVVDSGIDEVIISLDGADQEVYQKYRVGGRLDWVFDGIERLARTKYLHHSQTPMIHLQFILMRQNIHQQDDMIRIGKKLGADRISFKTVQVTDFEGGEYYLPEEPEFTRYQERTGDGRYITRKRCFFPDDCLRLWYSTVINCDGRISPCCFDKDGEYELGNLITDSFEKIWGGKSYQRFRQHLLKHRYDMEMCRDCSEGVKKLFTRTVDYHRKDYKTMEI
jgi:radical SAM protein with 4Fe4S-binding SPASM domain